MSYVTIDTVKMPLEAARSVEWAGVNVAEDLRALRSGETTADALLAECLAGAEPEHEGDWRDYVAAVCAAAERAAITTTYAQIAQLREEALMHGDLTMARICDLAIHGEIEPSAMSELPRVAQSRLCAMTQDEAQAECDRVIRSAQGEVAS